METHDTRPIALIGLMGAGKSVVARLLGERLGRSVVDLDEVLEAEAGTSIAELFERSGEAAFRRREAEVFQRALGSGAGVLACGGGVVLDPGHRAMLRARCHTVWLEVDPEEAARRVAADGAVRPLLAGVATEEKLRNLLRGRTALYQEAARFRVPTDARSPGDVADAVIEALRDERS